MRDKFDMLDLHKGNRKVCNCRAAQRQHVSALSKMSPGRQVDVTKQPLSAHSTVIGVIFMCTIRTKPCKLNRLLASKAETTKLLACQSKAPGAGNWVLLACRSWRHTIECCNRRSCASYNNNPFINPSNQPTSIQLFKQQRQNKN